MKNIINLLAISIAIIACNNNANNNSAATTAENSQSSATTPAVAGINHKYSWADFNLQGKVKKLTEYTYYQSEDQNGNPIEGEPFANDPVKVIFFSPQGLVTQINEYEENEQGAYAQTNFQYDPQNRLILVKKTNPDGKTATTEQYHYSPEGFLATYIYHDPNDQEEPSKIIYQTTSTPEGRKVEEKEGDNSDYEIKYYNTQNLMVKRVLYNPRDQKVVGEALYTYDANNRCQTETYKGIGSIFARSYCMSGTASCFYDKYGNLTKVSIAENPSTNGEDACEFAETNDYTKQYSYDPQGNVTRVVVGMGGEPVIQTYKIEYY